MEKFNGIAPATSSVRNRLKMTTAFIPTARIQDLQRSPRSGIHTDRGEQDT
jgi:hypothetical protein